MTDYPRIFYLRNHTGFPVACVAVVVDTSRTNILRVGISSHNPVDVYSKKKARQAAMGRAISNKPFLVTEKEPGVKKHLIEFIAAYPVFAPWAKGMGVSYAATQAAALWLELRKAREEAQAKKDKAEVHSTVVGRLLKIGESHTSYGFLVNPQEVF